MNIVLVMKHFALIAPSFFFFFGIWSHSTMKYL